MRVLTINNQKGGVGKTMLAVHAAWYFSEIKRQRTLFIDLDPQHNASDTLMSAAVEQTSFDLLTMDIRPRSKGPLTLLPSIPELAEIVAATEFERADMIDARGLIAMAAENLRAVKSDYDMAVIDTSPAWGVKNLVALSISDALLSPIDLEEFSLSGTEELLRRVQSVRRHSNDNLRFLGFVPSRVQTTSMRQRLSLVDLIRTFGTDVIFGGGIAQRSAFAEAISARRPVWQDKKTAARQARIEVMATLDLLAARLASLETPDAG